MKFTAATLFLIAQISGGMAAAVSSAAAECGSLGVMQVPAGADPANFRKCAGHPLGHARDLSQTTYTPLTPEQIEKAQNVKLDARSVIPALSGRGVNACWFGANSGCTKGYCWKSCGNNGEWCWTASSGGSGPWVQCNSANQCGSGEACGQGCKSGSNDCGCSC
ncbi:hypothetical protein ABW20_dc0108010 [Dactylellina cionopaga]|nr:hypothetical protein ABW20_dc0108010 [Dactylellina cionopaga]